MSDQELADSIAANRGRAFITFKEPGSAGGVDDWGRVLVSATTVTAGKAYLRSLDLTIEHEYVLTPTVLAVVPSSFVATIRSYPVVDVVEPDTRIFLEAQDTTWNVRRVRGPEAWTSSTGSGVKVLIIDTGVPNDHPDLSPAVIQACDGSNGLDQAGHGTHVSGIAAAVNNTVHVIGVGHGVALWSSKVNFLESQVKCAIEFGRINKTFAINMSFRMDPSTVVTDEIKGAYADGLLLVKSAGNTNGGAVTYPGTLAEVIAVTALDSNNIAAGFAAVDPKVELAAPGVDIKSTSLPAGTRALQADTLHYAAARRWPRLTSLQPPLS